MPRDGCIFCGGKPLTSEHVIANWLGKILPILGEGPAAGFATGRLDMEDPDDMRFYITRKSRKGGLKTPFEARRPCEKCNTGWMSDLEQQVMPWITPMVQGKHVTLPPFAVRSVATWCIKTATLYRYTDSPPVETPDYRNQWLFRHQTPPAGSFVFLGRYEGESVNALWHRTELVERSAPDETNNQVHINAVRLGDLTLLMMELFSGDQATLTVPEQWKPGLIALWPPTGGNVRWPPPRFLTDAGIRQLVHIFDPVDSPKQRQRKPPKRRK